MFGKKCSSNGSPKFISACYRPKQPPDSHPVNVSWRDHSTVLWEPTDQTRNNFAVPFLLPLKLGGGPIIYLLAGGRFYQTSGVSAFRDLA